MKQKKATSYALLYASFLVYSFSAVCAKYASQQSETGLKLLFITGEFFLLAVYALMWQQTLKRFPLIVAMSSKGVTVIYGLLWSVLLFREHITINNIIGAAMVILGIGLVSSDG